MHNEDVPLGLNVITIFVAAQCYSMRKFREFSIKHKHVFESIDRTMHDIVKKSSPYGGLTVLLTGDCRKILPINCPT